MPRIYNYETHISTNLVTYNFIQPFYGLRGNGAKKWMALIFVRHAMVKPKFSIVVYQDLVLEEGDNVKPVAINGQLMK